MLGEKVKTLPRCITDQFAHSNEDPVNILFVKNLLDATQTLQQAQARKVAEKKYGL